MILSLFDRITIGNILPRCIDDEFGLNDLYAARAIDIKIRFSPEEIEQYQIKIDNGTIRWASEGVLEVEFDINETALIQKCFAYKIQKKHFTIEMLNTYDMFAKIH